MVVNCDPHLVEEVKEILKTQTMKTPLTQLSFPFPMLLAHRMMGFTFASHKVKVPWDPLTASRMCCSRLWSHCCSCLVCPPWSVIHYAHTRCLHPCKSKSWSRVYQFLFLTLSLRILGKQISQRIQFYFGRSRASPTLRTYGYWLGTP